MNQEKHQQNSKLGLYIHIPFCANICDYCAFYHELANKQKIEQYLYALTKEISSFHTHRKIDTIYWGGGTPIILNPEEIKILGTLCKLFINKQPSEWTVEIAPISSTKEKLQALKDIGVNRLSIGIQSFNDKTLKTLGRKQTEKIAIKTYELARKVGFKNIGLDFIFSVPGQTLDEWEKDLEKAIGLQPEHISTYNLTFEGNSSIVTQKNAGYLQENSENIASEFCLFTWSFLEQQKYKQYEISNFAKPGFESIHNINTWLMQEWIGFGPSASSQFQNKRYTNVASLNSWHDKIIKKQPHTIDNCELTNDILAIDSIIFGLRMNKGVDFNVLKKRFISFDFSIFDNLIQQLINEGLAKYFNDILQLTTQGRLVADAVALEFINYT